MAKIGLRNRVGRLNCKRVIIIIVIALVIVGVVAVGLRFFGGDKDVGFKILNEAEIPQQIAAQVIPEYRQLERALASVVDGKVYVVATRGEKPTSGYELEIAKMTLEKDGDTSTLIVFVKFRDPQPGMSLTQALTYPLIVAETDLTSLPDQIQLRVQYME
ncbi:MAG TPA: protease complex subunit PrcB family protein [Anaerovoracaceae bacterium]|nr:protease complex subunit PrcB family protein [Anaerovoracaceae bacterium]